MYKTNYFTLCLSVKWTISGRLQVGLYKVTMTQNVKMKSQLSHTLCHLIVTL